MLKKSNLILLFAVISALPNDSNLGSEAGNVFPLQHNSIQMLSEDIHIYMSIDTIFAICNFTFVNNGTTDTVLMGFPALTCTDMDVEPIRNFTTAINRKDVPVKLINNSDNIDCEECNNGRSWYTWEVISAHGDTLNIRNTYSGDIGSSLSGTVFMDYIIGTGKTWHEGIKNGKVTFHHGQVASNRFITSDFKQLKEAKNFTIQEHEDSLVFKFSDLVPACNQSLGVGLIGIQKFPIPQFTLDDYLKEKIKSRQFTATDYRLMRNEIFARRGYVFKDSSLTRHFSTKIWYQPDNTFKPEKLSNFEKELISFLKQEEEKATSK
jgi:hypothetical protein